MSSVTPVRLLLIQLLLVSITPSWTANAQEWVLRQAGLPQPGARWSCSVDLGDGYLLFGSENGTLVRYAVADRTVDLIHVGTCSDITAMARTAEFIVVGDKHGEIRVSTDGGTTWDVTAVCRGTVTSLSNTSPSQFLACSSDGELIAVNAAEGTYSTLLDVGARGFVWADAVGDKLTVVGRKGVVYHSGDRGESWSLTQHDTLVDFVQCHRVDDTTLLLGCYRTAIIVSVDNGRSLTHRHDLKTYPERNKDSEIDPMTCLTSVSQRLVATGPVQPLNNKFYFNAYYSDDLGRTWVPVAYPEPTVGIAVLIPTTIITTANGQLYFALMNNTVGVVSICSSLDRGSSWSIDTTLVRPLDRYEDYEDRTALLRHQFIDVEKAGDRLIALARLSLEGRVLNHGTAVLISDDLAGSWAPAAVLPPNIFSLQAIGRHVAVGCDSGSVMMSHDGGRSFEPRLFVDTAVAWNTVTVSGATSLSQFAVHSSLRRAVADGEQQGRVMTLDINGTVNEMPLARRFNNDLLTKPIADGGKLHVVYSEVDSSRRILRSFLTVWDVTQNQVSEIDITEQVRSVVEYHCEVVAVTEKHFWVVVDKRLLRIDRMTGAWEFLDTLSDGSVYSANGSTQQLISIGDAVISINQFDVLMMMDGSPSWDRVEVCGTSALTAYRPRSGIEVAPNTVLIVGDPVNYFLDIPPTTMVSDVDTKDKPIHSIAAPQGDPIYVSGDRVTECQVTDLSGRTWALGVESEGHRFRVQTQSLVPGWYGLSWFEAGVPHHLAVLVTP